MLGHIHTHPPTAQSLIAGHDGGFSRYDINYAKDLLDRPSFIIAWDNSLDAIYWRPNNSSWSRLDMSGYKRDDLLKGTIKLVPFLKEWKP